MEHKNRTMIKRWLAIVICLCMVFPSAVTFATGAEETAKEVSIYTGGLCEHHPMHTEECGYVEDIEGSTCAFVCTECGKETSEEPKAEPLYVAVPQAEGNEYYLTDSAFNLKGILTIDGEEPDEDTVIEDGTPFNVRLEWTFPSDGKYTEADTFTYTLPETISVTDRTGEITQSSGEKIGTYKIEDGKVSIQYRQSFLEEQDRSAWLNIRGQFDLDETTSPGGTITITLPGDVQYKITVKGEGDLSIDKKANKHVDNKNHKVYIDYELTVTAVKRNTNVTIQDTISAAMGSMPKNDKIRNWKLTSVEGNGCTVNENFFTSTDYRTAFGTIWEMPEGSSVTIKYTIEVDSTGIMEDTPTTYTNTATASSDQTKDVEDTESVDILPTAISKIGSLDGDKDTVY